MAGTRKTDMLIAGGGLAGGLIALGLAQKRPETKVTIVDATPQIGGNHIWSFFDSDIAPTNRWLVAPLVCHHWPGHDVRFPSHNRTLRGAYNSIRSERLNQLVREVMPSEAILAAQITELSSTGAVLADGSRIEAAGVIDARGFGNFTMLDLGWQKFLGQLLRLDAPHGLQRPVIMDAAVDQTDGYRFVYLLPLDADSIFVEDTYYSLTSELDVGSLRQRIAAYAARQGWRIKAIEREEMAALPIVMGGEFDRLWPEQDSVARAGIAAGMFQPMTGYSLPDAVRAASLVVSLQDLSSPTLRRELRSFARDRWKDGGYYRLLARMLFRAADPPERYRLLQRFYRLDESLIGRFYAGHSTFADRVRILAGKPPVALHRALGAIRERQ